MQLVVTNKNDLDGAINRYKQLKIKIKNQKLISISALKGQNIDLLRELIIKNLKKSKYLEKKLLSKKSGPIIMKNNQNDLLNKEFNFVKKKR